MRVYLDTNVLVSAFATRGLCADVFRLVLAEHELVTGEVNLEELRRVLRDRIKIPAKIVAEILDLVREHTVVPRPSRESAIPIRDPDDAWVLASAEAATVDVMVTGDRDFLEIVSQVPFRIVNPRGFWDLAQGPAPK